VQVSHPALAFTGPERAEVRQLLTGARPELSPQVIHSRTSRLSQVKASAIPSLGWCSRCTRVFSTDGLTNAATVSPSGALAANDHRCAEFMFPGFDGLCADCACARGATIPCLVTGQMFHPRPDPSVAGFGHTLVSPEIEATIHQGGIIGPDRSIRAITASEAGAAQAVGDAKHLFKTCPVDIKPRSYFVSSPHPHWMLGHYVRIRAEAVGLEVAVGGYDVDGIYYARVDHEAFQLKIMQGRLELDMAIDPQHFSVEKASALGGMAAGAVSGGLQRASWGVHAWGGGKAVAAGAALGAFQGLMAAGQQKRQAEAARQQAMVAHAGSTFEAIGKIVNSPLMSEPPPILADAAQPAQRARLSTWPAGVNVGRAAERLAQFPY
jgi:hypothetical protein